MTLFTAPCYERALAPRLARGLMAASGFAVLFGVSASTLSPAEIAAPIPRPTGLSVSTSADSPNAMQGSAAFMAPSTTDRPIAPRAWRASGESKLSTLPTEVRAVVGHVVLLPLSSPLSRVVVGDVKVADYRLVSPTELYVLGKAVGTTNLLLWRKQGGPPQSLVVTVAMDTQPLADSLSQTLPQEHDVALRMAAGSVVLSGSVANTMAFDAAGSLADAFMRPVGLVAAGPSRVINLLRVRDAQQVMLDVRIAEVSKTLLDKLGLGLRAGGGANPRWNILSNFLGGGGGTAGLLFGNGSAVDLEAEKKDGLVRILAEPSIVAMSGQEGSFLVGGKVIIPVAQSGSGTGSSVTLQEREFGVGLKFVPTVLDGGRVSLKVATEVSEVSKEAISLSSVSGTAVLPAFTTRRVATSVQLLDGQSLAIGGLIRNNFSTSTSAFPFLGGIPILGALFRSSQFVSDQTELVVVVRASLVQASESAPALPSDTVVPPGRSEFFLERRLQAAPMP